MKEYRIIKNPDAKILESAINSLMFDGGKPIGGVSYDGENYLQAILEDEND